LILELASFLGTSVGGKLFGIISDTMSERRHAERERRQLEHEANLATRGALKDHVKMLNTADTSGRYSPLAWVVAVCIFLFCVTYCVCTLYCFLINPTEVILSKDPTAGSAQKSFFFGLVKWDVTNNKVLEMSKAGVGFLMSYPIIFILSMVVTGDKPKGR